MRVRNRFEDSRFEPVRFGAEEMAQVANEASRVMHERIGRGETVEGRPATPLSPGYARYKSRRGLPAIRDWTLTGETLAQLRVVEVSPGSATVAFDGASNKLLRLARWNAERDQMIGLSEADQQQVLNVQESLYAEMHQRRGR